MSYNYLYQIFFKSYKIESGFYNETILYAFASLIFGLFLYAVGIVVTMNAHIGYAPWDVFHVGFAKTIGMSIGTASIITGVIIGIITIFFGEKLGLGTILNMVLIGVFLDMLVGFQIIPVASNFVFGIIMMIIGLFIIA